MIHGPLLKCAQCFLCLSRIMCVQIMLIFSNIPFILRMLFIVSYSKYISTRAIMENADVCPFSRWWFTRHMISPYFEGEIRMEKRMYKKRCVTIWKMCVNNVGNIETSVSCFIFYNNSTIARHYYCYYYFLKYEMTVI